MVGSDGLLYVPEYTGQPHHARLIETVDAQQ
jgi:hypothetical protein